MAYAHAMLASHPGSADLADAEVTAACIRACLDCAQACSACASACLDEESVGELRSCIRRDLACADICEATGRVLSRRPAEDPATVRALLEACMTVCAACAQECEAHAGMHEHCRICAEACRRCEEACRDLLAAIA